MAEPSASTEASPPPAESNELSSSASTEPTAEKTEEKTEEGEANDDDLILDEDDDVFEEEHKFFVKIDNQEVQLTHRELMHTLSNGDLHSFHFNGGFGLLLKTLDLKDVTQALTFSHTITRLTLTRYDVKEIGPIVSLLSANKNLAQLILNYNSIDGTKAEHLAKALEDNTSLIELDIFGNKIGTTGINALSRMLQTNKSLTSLTIGGPYDGVEELFVALETNEVMSHITLMYSKVHEEGMTALAKALKENKTIEHLDFYGCDLGDKGTIILAKALVGSSVSWLNLSANRVADEGAKELGNMLADNTSLTYLDLEGNHITDIGVDAIATGMMSNTSLTQLNMNRNRQQDISKFGPVIGQNASLKTLQLSEYNDCKTLLPIVEGLKTNTTLRRLDFPTKVGDAGKVADDIAAANLKMNVTLREGNAPDPAVNQYLIRNRLCAKYGIDGKLQTDIPTTLKDEKSIEDYIKDLLEGTAEWRAMKLIILGNGRIGKTTYVQFLKESLGITADKPQYGTKSTIGIECSLLEMAGGTISVWDFAGQIEYTVTHQFFLSNEMVLYVVCYDLSEKMGEQRRQINTWLRYLNSLLNNNVDPNATFDHSKSNWKVIVAGTKADKKTEAASIDDTTAWQRAFPAVPMVEPVYHTSTLEDPPSAKRLYQAMEEQCKEIIDNHSAKVPKSYKALLEDVKAIETPNSIVSVHETLSLARWKGKEDLIKRALKFLHDVGEVVLFGNRVCTKPSVVSSIMAKFISPEDVRNALLIDEDTQVALLSKKEIDTILGVNKKGKTRNLMDELELMAFFGVCFEIPQPKGVDEQLFLFPSLGDLKQLKFTLDPKEGMTYRGVKVSASKSAIFVPGLFCQFIVSLCRELNIYRREIQHVCSNGALLSCSSMMDGQLIIYTRPDGDTQSIIFAMMASSPDLDIICGIFDELIETKFMQYRGYGREDLCHKCVETFFARNSTAPDKYKIDTAEFKNCNNGHQTELPVPVFRPSSNLTAEPCWTHKKHAHDFFLNYRVATEGGGKKPVVQEVYESLIRRKKENGDSVFVFWDKKCLNYGQDWEKGFLNGLQNATVLVLLISLKALEGIQTKAASTQDNVLLEYECAILQNKLKGTFVLPVFVGDERLSEGKVEFERFSMSKASNFPDAPHKRNQEASRIIREYTSKMQTHDREFLSSIKSTMAQIFKFQGIHMTARGSKKDELDEMGKVLMQILNERTRGHSGHVGGHHEDVGGEAEDESAGEFYGNPTIPAQYAFPPRYDPSAFANFHMAYGGFGHYGQGWGRTYGTPEDSFAGGGYAPMPYYPAPPVADPRSATLDYNAPIPATPADKPDQPAVPLKETSKQEETPKPEPPKPTPTQNTLPRTQRANEIQQKPPPGMKEMAPRAFKREPSKPTDITPPVREPSVKDLSTPMAKAPAKDAVKVPPPADNPPQQEKPKEAPAKPASQAPKPNPVLSKPAQTSKLAAREEEVKQATQTRAPIVRTDSTPTPAQQPAKVTRTDSVPSSVSKPPLVINLKATPQSNAPTHSSSNTIPSVPSSTTPHFTTTPPVSSTVSPSTVSPQATLGSLAPIQNGNSPQSQNQNQQQNQQQNQNQHQQHQHQNPPNPPNPKRPSKYAAVFSLLKTLGVGGVLFAIAVFFYRRRLAQKQIKG